MAGAERLNKFGEWSYLDSLSKTYNYTHDEVFHLSWKEVMTMIAYNKEYDYIEETAHKIQIAAEKKE